MALQFIHLDQRTRRLMSEELDQDIAEERLYLSPRLSEHGRIDWPNLLREAIDNGDEQALAQALRNNGRINPTEHRRTRSGASTVVRVPTTAPETLAEGEFNRYYIRGVCRQAIENGQDKVEVYRAKQVDHPRSESQRKIGQLIDAASLLEDVRSHPGIDTALGLPPGPNSGLSVRLPDEKLVVYGLIALGLPPLVLCNEWKTTRKRESATFARYRSWRSSVIMLRSTDNMSSNGVIGR